jgi:hypothetical protein
MKTGLIGTILASLTLSSVASDLVAQGRALTSIDGFNGMAWGSSDSAIRAEYSEPTQVDSLENGIVVLAYRENLLGEPAVALFAVFDDHGLIKGQHIVKLKLGAGDCEAQYRVYRDHLTLTYPLISPVETADFPFAEDFCTALQNGRGWWVTQWTDPSNGSVATVIVQQGTDEVKLIYESAVFLNWLNSQAPGEN